MAKNIISVCLIVLFSCLSTSAQELNSASAFQGTWNGTIKTIAYAEKQNITMEIKVLKEIQVIFGVEGQKKKDTAYTVIKNGFIRIPYQITHTNTTGQLSLSLATTSLIVGTFEGSQPVNTGVELIARKVSKSK